MPTPTMTLIQETVLSSPASSVTFTSIPQTYKDLVLELSNCNHSYAGSGAVYDQFAQFNSDTANNYSNTKIYGESTYAISTRNSNNASIAGTYPMASSGIGVSVMHVMSYASTSVYKTTLLRDSVSPSAVTANVGLWRSTAAINSIRIGPSGSYTMSAGTTVRLYGLVG